MASGTFVTAINCMDGRVIIPVIQWMKDQYQVDYVDMITEAGPDKVLSQGTTVQIESIKNRVLVSVEKHHSKIIAIVGHHDCAGNPVTREVHHQQIINCCEIVKTWGLAAQIIGIWLNDKWEIELIDS